MDIEFLKAFFVGIGFCILLFAIFVSLRNKSIGCGLWTITFLLLLFLVSVGGIGLLYWYSRHVPTYTQVMIGRIAFLGWVITCYLFVFQYNLRIKAGNPIPFGGTRNKNVLRIAIAFLVGYSILTMTSDLFYGTSVDESVRRNTIWWILAIIFSLRLFFSFEFREKGFVYYGKVILFSTIEHAEWENSMYKTSLRLRLKRKDKEISIKTPWELITPIDKFIKANFPPP